MPGGGGVFLGSSATRYLTFSNTGGSPMQVTDLVTGGDFSLGVGDCGPTPFLLAAGQECMAPVVFTPSAAGPQARTVILPDSGAQVSMFGAGVARADLQISMAGPAEAKVKDDFSYIITVTNAGPNPATNVVVTDWLPDVNTFVSVVAPDFTCVTPPPGTNGSVSGELASLGAGQSRRL